MWVEFVDKNNEVTVDEEEKEKELSKKMEKQLSPRKAIFRIIIAIAAFLWFLAGGSAQTVLSLSGGGMGLVGVVSFLIRNPVTFLIIGLIQIVMGILFLLFFVSYAFMTIFHFLWSIRWFYGYHKYRKLNRDTVSLKS